MKAVKALILAFLLCFAFAALADVAVPPLTGRVVDLTATLSSDQAATLEQTLKDFEDRKGSQVAVLIVPTTLMGASLPLLSRHFVSRADSAAEVGTRVGALYAVNTLGAVVGVFLAGFVLMPKFGVAATNACAVAMNVVLGLAVLALRKQLGESGRPARAQDAAPAAPEEAASPALAFPPRVRRLSAIAFALSGFCSLLYEVVWSRALVNKDPAFCQQFP